MYRPAHAPFLKPHHPIQRSNPRSSSKPFSSIGFTDSVKKIQRWWRCQILKKQKRIHSQIFRFEESFAEKPSKLTQIDDSTNSFNLNSSIQSRAAELFQYLDETEAKSKSKQENNSFISQAALVNYRLELEEALKTIDSLKVVIQKIKKEAAAKEEENKKSLDLALEKQRLEFEELGIKNMNFIEQLLMEKQQRISQLTELSQKIKEMEGKHLKNLQDVREKADKELKKQRDSWVTSEKNKRNTWMKEKTKEIKENTTKGLEPEIMRILAENKRNIEKMKDEQEIEMKRYKQQLDHDYESKLQDIKDDLKARYDETLEKERESYQGRLRELHVKQEEELLNMRKKWSDESAQEKQRIHEVRIREETSNVSKLKNLQSEYSEKIEELTRRHQSILEEVEVKHENKLKKLKQELAFEKEEWINSQVVRINKELDEKKEMIRNDLALNRDKEIKLIISKLSEEKVTYKKKVDKETEAKLKVLTEKHQLQIDEYEKIVENLKEKVEKSNSVRKNQTENFQTLAKKIQDQELLISKLEGEKLHLKEEILNLELKIDSYKDGQGELIEEVRREERKKSLILQQEIEITKEQMELIKEKYEEKLSQIAQKEGEEFEAIEARVKATITRKDEKIREVMQELQISKLKITKLEELLEKQRKSLMQI
jgi:5-azacytidine-induced protein 1